MDTKGGSGQAGEVGGVMNWVMGIDMCTLMYIKLMTNKNLLYKKINKIQKEKDIKKDKNGMFSLRFSRESHVEIWSRRFFSLNLRGTQTSKQLT